jgi:trehalose 6-phosphate phosphatase
MSTLNLLTAKGRGDLARFVTPQTLFAFDLDGTLAPIAVHAWEVKLAPAVRASLKRLDQLARVCVLTGRSREAALAILDLELSLVIGNHGCEWPPEIRPRNRSFLETSLIWRDRLGSELSDDPGIEIEDKGETLALHYRRARGPSARERIEGAIRKLEPAPRVIGGKFVMNLLPMEAQTKGGALLEAMALLGAPRAFYSGDDLTDEEVFQLGRAQLFGVHVGSENWTAAPYYLDSQSEVEGVLGALVKILEERDQS